LKRGVQLSLMLSCLDHGCIQPAGLAGLPGYSPAAPGRSLAVQVKLCANCSDLQIGHACNHRALAIRCSALPLTRPQTDQGSRLLQAVEAALWATAAAGSRSSCSRARFHITSERACVGHRVLRVAAFSAGPSFPPRAHRAAFSSLHGAWVWHSAWERRSKDTARPAHGVTLDPDAPSAIHSVDLSRGSLASARLIWPTYSSERGASVPPPLLQASSATRQGAGAVYSIPHTPAAGDDAAYDKNKTTSAAAQRAPSAADGSIADPACRLSQPAAALSQSGRHQPIARTRNLFPAVARPRQIQVHLQRLK
jgi:hypothetical protein